MNEIYQAMLKQYGELKAKEREYSVRARDDYDYSRYLSEVREELEKLDRAMQPFEEDM